MYKGDTHNYKNHNEKQNYAYKQKYPDKNLLQS